MKNDVEKNISAGQKKYKPYPEYKNAGVDWLGRIPAHWNTIRLKRLFKVINGSTPQSGVAEYWDGDIAWVTPEDLGKLVTGEIKKSDRCITDAGYRTCGTSLVPAGSLVLSTRAPIGHLAICCLDLCTNQGCRALVFRWKDNKYFYYYLILTAKPELESWGQGSTFKELGKSKLEEIYLVQLDAAEQRAITVFLNRKTAKIDALIKKKEKLIELLQVKRTAIISHAVNKGLDPNVPMKDSGVEWLGKIPVHWEVKRLKYLITSPLKYGANESAELDDPDLPRYVRITDIDENDGLRAETFKSLPAEVANEYLLREGDLLFARSGATAGKTFLYRRSWGVCAFAGYLIRAQLNLEKACPEFVKYFTSSLSYWQWISSVFIQATIQNVSAARYASMLTPQPSMCEQREIVAFLNRELMKIDALITKIHDAIEKLTEYRAALISAAVTGKIDVRGEA